AARWLREWKDGIDDTGIRPGFIKIGVDAGALTVVNRKLVLAAARTHLENGLTIAAHTGDGVAALEEMKVLARRKPIMPTRFAGLVESRRAEREKSAPTRNELPRNTRASVSFMSKISSLSSIGSLPFVGG